jgi:hypothetical protein
LWGGGVWGSKLERRFELLWRILNGPELVREFQFHPTRKWRADFAHLRRGLHTPLICAPPPAKLSTMKKYLLLLLAFAGSFVFSSCSFSVKTQKNPAGIDIRTTTE